MIITIFIYWIMYWFRFVLISGKNEVLVKSTGFALDFYFLLELNANLCNASLTSEKMGKIEESRAILAGKRKF